jgi:RNA polymerase sigma factor (sigma-70 family)
MRAFTPEQLFEAHLDMALMIGRSFPLVGHAIDESEQEARIALWKAAGSYDPSKGAFDPYASTVIRNHLRNAFKKAKRTSVEVTTLDGPAINQADSDGESLKETSILSPDASPLLEAERNDIRETLREGIASLTPTQQEALQSYADGNNYAEIARENGVSKAAVRQMVQRAADQVRPEIVSRGVSGIAFMPASHNEPNSPDSSEYGFSHYKQEPPSGKGGYLLILIVLVVVLIVLGIPILSAVLGR